MQRDTAKALTLALQACDLANMLFREWEWKDEAGSTTALALIKAFQLTARAAVQEARK